jgi:HEAT repeat protein
MLFPAIVIALLTSLANLIAQKTIEKGVGSGLSYLFTQFKPKVEQQLGLGKYEGIQRALDRAREDILAKCRTEAERRVASRVLDALLESEPGPLMTEFSNVVTQTYLFPSGTPPTQPLAQIYRKVCGPVALLKGDIPDEAALSVLLDDFFKSYQEKLLEEEDFSYLREYFRLTEERKQTAALEKIASQVPDIDWNAIDKEYRDYLRKKLEYHKIRGFSPRFYRQIQDLPLAKIFLPLQIREGRPALAEYAEEELRPQTPPEKQQAAPEKVDELDWQRRQEEMEKHRARLSASQAAQRPLTLAGLLKQPCSVLLGNPGSGKTTITKYVTYALAVNDLTRLGMSVRGLVPVLIQVAEYARAYEHDNTLHLTEYIETELAPRPEFGSYLKQAITKGKCLVILDGLDEVADSRLRMQITNRIQEMVASFSNNRFLVTSRVVGYDFSPLSDEFKKAHLQDLAPKDQERFVRLWYGAIQSVTGDSSSTDEAERLIETLRDKPEIAQIAANPLLLTLIALMHWHARKLPTRRVQVYECATETLVDYWTYERVVRVDAEYVKRILAPIAYDIVSKSVSHAIAESDIRTQLINSIVKEGRHDYAEARDMSRQLMRDLSEQIGLFLESGQDTATGEPVYTFLHDTFGEYLAALVLAEEMQNGTFKLEQYIHRSMWHEPLLFLAGHLAIHSRPQANILIRHILDFPSPDDDVLQRNVLLASECLADDVEIELSLRDEVLEKLAKLLDNVASQVRQAAPDRYKRLAATWHCRSAVSALKRIYPFDSVQDLEKYGDRICLSLASAYVHLDETDIADLILQHLEGKPYNLYQVQLYQVQRLRFESRPQQAAAYLLQLQADKDHPFSLYAGLDLSSSALGPIDAGLARRVLGESGFVALTEELLRCTQDDHDRAKLRWMIALAPEEPSIEALLNLTSSEMPAYIRRFSATRLLDIEHHPVAVSTLRDLVHNESTEAPVAAQVLLNEDEAADLDLNLLRDTALNTQYFCAPDAIIILLKTKDRQTGLAAALHFLSICKLEEDLSPTRFSIAESLVKHGYAEIGLAAARWLALYPGHRYRLEACDLLREAGRVSDAVSLFQYLAYEYHDGDSLNACRQLLILHEANRVVPLLTRVKTLGNPDMRYQACQTLTLAGDIAKSLMAQRSELQAAVMTDRTQAYQTALSDFCRIGLKALDELEPTGDETRAIIELARYSLSCLFTPRDISRLPQELVDSCLSAVSINTALFELQSGQPDRARQRLVSLLSQDPTFLSIPVRLRALVLLGYTSGPETTRSFIRSLEDEDDNIRLLAARSLGKLSDPIAVQPLIDTLLTDKTPEVRRGAVHALEQLGDPIAIQPLITALVRDGQSIVRSAAAYALGQFGNCTALRPLINAMKDKDEAGLVRQSAAYALGKLGDPVALDPLTEALEDKNDNLRLAAVEALGQIRNLPSIAPLVSALKDKNSEVRKAAAEALGQLNDLTAIQPLTDILKDEDRGVRQTAVDALRRLGNPASASPLIVALRDKDSKIRGAAADVLGRLGDPAAVRPLMDVLRDEKISDVRKFAAWGLGQLGDSSTVQPLVTALDDENSEVRWFAAVALGQLGDPAAVQPLITALGDENSYVRFFAAYALGQLGDLAAIQPLIIALNDEDATVRECATTSLGQIGTPFTCQHLLAALCSQDSKVRSSAAEALGQLGDPVAIRPLIACLCDDSNEVVASAAYALGYLKATEAIPILLTLPHVGYDLVRCLAHLDPVKALVILDRYAPRFRRDSWPEHLRGQAFWQLDNMDSAFTWLDKAVQKRKTRDNLLALAHFHLEQGNPQMAEEYVDQALKGASYYDRALCWLSQAVVLWHSGQAAKGLEKLQKAQRMNKHITRVKNLQYESFWRVKAIRALETMLAQAA